MYMCECEEAIDTQSLYLFSLGFLLLQACTMDRVGPKCCVHMT